MRASDVSSAVSALTPEQRALFERLLRQRGVDLLGLPIPPRQNRDAAPLSATQQRLWTIGELTRHVVGNVPIAFHVEGRFDATQFKHALAAVAARHEILRTSFKPMVSSVVAAVGLQALELSGVSHETPTDRRRPRRVSAGGRLELQQTIAPRVEVPVEEIEASGASEQTRFADAIARSETEARRPFDLMRPPLLRCTIIRIGAQEHVVTLTTHHLVTDGWGARILLRDLAESYSAQQAARLPQLPDLSIGYGDYALWQRQMLGGRALDAQVAYWRDRLRNLPASVDLTDCCRPRHAAHPGSAVHFSLGPELSAAVREFRRQEAVTPFMLLLAAFTTVSFGYSCQPDQLVATTVSSRNHPETEHVVGNFANNVLLRIDCSGNPSFSALLTRVRDTVTEAFAHQELPIEQLFELLQADHQSGPVQPVRHVFIVRDNTLEDGFVLAHARARALTLDPGPMFLDMMTDITVGSTEVSGAIDYRPDVVSAARVGSLVTDFQRVLAAAIARPERLLSELVPPRLVSVAAVGPIRVAARATPRDMTMTERRVMAIWQSLLGVQEVGVSDGFFSLGGHSLLMARLAEALRIEFGWAPPLASLFEHQTLEHLARLIESGVRAIDGWATLEPLQEAGNGMPFVAVHTEDGFFSPLARHLGTDRPFHALQTRVGLDGSEPFAAPCETIEELAARYVDLLERVHGERPCVLAGYCLGGLVALEMAQQLTHAGRSVPLVVLLDAFPFLGRPDLLSRNAMRAVWRREEALASSLEATLRWHVWAWRGRVARAEIGLWRAAGLRTPQRPVRAWITQVGAHMILRYTPKIYTGDVVLISTPGGPGRRGLRAYSTLLRGHVTRHEVPDSHLAMMAEPTVRRVAAILREELGAMDAMDRIH